MRQSKCGDCGLSGALNSTFIVNGKAVCEPCGDKLVRHLRETKQEMRVSRAVDPTICVHCQADNGNLEFTRAGKLPLCATCTVQVYERQFPQWLKLSAIGLMLLLCVALVHGVPYFRAGKSLVLGERYLDSGEYSKALPLLESVMASAPDSEEVRLLTAKAYLLSGRPDRAQKIFQQHPVFEKGDLTNEVLGLWNQVVKASEKVELANKLNDEKKWEEANKAWHEATGLYPQSEAFKMGAEVQDVVVEFEKKDYDRLLSLSEGLWKRHAESSMASGMFASALACKFAVTGDPEFKRKSEEQLEKSRTLAQGSPEEAKQFDEYAERIRYRLSSREIIDTDEYNRRFRPTPAVKKGN